ncbi:hypothetical protein QF019_003795 [Pseudomonas frederiksbergensis]|uniref:PD-(D/E)XK motif protein n=1 Tax=Pseudomonas frederiksbergensis TaxID=104087 RepID=UPI003D1FE642
MTLRTGAFDVDIYDIPTIPSSVETAYGPARYALGKDGSARILLPLNPQEKLPKFPQTSALIQTELTIKRGGKLLRFLDIECCLSKLEKVFSDVVNEIFNRVKLGTRCSEAYLSTLQDFRNLLVAPQTENVSHQAVLGLIGELVLLEHLLHKNPNSWNTWRGPLLDRHDFRSETNAIEVKVSGFKSNNKIIISSFEQLIEPENGSLFLYHLVLEETNSGITVSNQTQKVLDLSSSIVEIRTRLANIGCTDPHSEAWNKSAFNIEKITLYKVTKDFPRLTVNSFTNSRIPKGVQDLQYTINLDDACSCIVESDELENILTGFIE